jgi:hypothetical protein
MFPGAPSLMIVIVSRTELVESSQLWISAASALLSKSVSEIRRLEIAESVVELNFRKPLPGSLAAVSVEYL